MFVPSLSYETSSTFAPYFISILVSSLDDDNENENTSLPSHLPLDESIQHAHAPTTPLPRWVHST
jgi:hypothetical protein